MLAHDLRGPLTAIRGAATLLIQAHDELPLDRVLILLRIIEAQSGLMTDKIEDLLAADRLHGDRLRLFDEDSDLAALVANCLGAARAATPGRRLRASAILDGLTVHADSERVAQVLRILLDNAVRYTPETGWIEVRAERENGLVRVEVRDRGPGVPAAAAQTIFGRFQRLETGGPGSGLGLYVARGLARAMGGDCGYEDRPGGGAIFWFTLPAATRRK